MRFFRALLLLLASCYDFPTTVSITPGSLSVAAQHACLIIDNKVQCWGQGSRGALGNGQDGSSDAPVAVTGLMDAAFGITTGNQHSCAWTGGPDVFCWGIATDAWAGGSSNSFVPVPVMTTGEFPTSVAIGDFFGCGVFDGDVWCWGNNDHGQLGGTGGSPDAAVTLAGDAVSVVAGTRFACALMADGDVWCWGSHPAGATSEPTRLALGGFHKLAGGGGRHACGLRDEGVYCWGEADGGKLGTGLGSDTFFEPQRVNGSDRWGEVLDLDLHGDHSTFEGRSCATTNDSLYCWGFNDFDQFGATPQTSVLLPVSLGWASSLGEDLLEVGVSRGAVCVLTSSSRIWCSGTGVNSDTTDLAQPYEVTF